MIRLVLALLATMMLAVPASAKPAAKATSSTDWTRTVAAMVEVPAEGVMHITDGCACESPYHAVSLS